MPSLPHTLSHLAVVIHLMEERAERTPIPFLREQICKELEKMTKRFEVEYNEFLAATGQSHTAEMLRRAA